MTLHLSIPARAFVSFVFQLSIRQESDAFRVVTEAPLRISVLDPGIRRLLQPFDHSTIAQRFLAALRLGS